MGARMGVVSTVIGYKRKSPFLGFSLD